MVAEEDIVVVDTAVAEEDTAAAAAAEIVVAAAAVGTHAVAAAVERIRQEQRRCHQTHGDRHEYLVPRQTIERRWGHNLLSEKTNA